MKKILSLIALLFFSFSLVACSDGMIKGTGESDHSSGLPAEDGNDGEEPSQIPAGQLTASEWKDLDNYDFYLNLFVNNDNEKGIFSTYLNNSYLNLQNMITVEVKNNDKIVRDAKVEMRGEKETTLMKAFSDQEGKAYFFPSSGRLEEITSIYVEKNGVSITQDYQYTGDNRSVSIEISAASSEPAILELMFVIDTTGSMGDEINYLKAEIADVISRVSGQLSNVEIRLALLFYRDHGDEYVTRYFDFTTDIAQQQSNLSKQSAAGGGDYPEAVDEALDEAVKKQWSANSTKLLFHVLDAPPHDTQANMSRFAAAITSAAEQGIRMIPVASSGVDKFTEFLLRAEAMTTGGTYVFLTNDSGIGNEKIEASVGKTVVEYLNDLIVRLIIEYQTGVKGEKIPYNQKQS